jgi:hypothetical protein
LVWWINAAQPILITGQLAALAGPLGLFANSEPEIVVWAVCAELDADNAGY